MTLPSSSSTGHPNVGMDAGYWGAGEPAGPSAERSLLGSYGDYAAAQAAVDHLSDQRFPVEHTMIVGSDLRLVERVTGRLTLGRAAAAGAAGGAWWGLFLGLLLGLFTSEGWGSWLAVVVTALLIGAGWGALFGLAAHSLTGGRRDFASQSTLTASRYDVLVSASHADQARQLLARRGRNPDGTAR